MTLSKSPYGIDFRYLFYFMLVSPDMSLYCFHVLFNTYVGVEFKRNMNLWVLCFIPEVMWD